MHTKTFLAAAFATIGAIDSREQSHVPTQAQLDIIRMAGQRAVAMTMASL